MRQDANRRPGHPAVAAPPSLLCTETLLARVVDPGCPHGLKAVVDPALLTGGESAGCASIAER
jgi:hypothetical protein